MFYRVARLGEIFDVLFSSFVSFDITCLRVTHFFLDLEYDRVRSDFAVISFFLFSSVILFLPSFDFLIFY